VAGADKQLFAWTVNEAPAIQAVLQVGAAEPR
jgi:hypothetical protein